MRLSNSRSLTSAPRCYKPIFLQQIRRGLGLALHRGWAKPMLGRFRDLVQHPNKPGPAAAVATDADNEGACAFYHHNHPFALIFTPVAIRGGGWKKKARFFGISRAQVGVFLMSYSTSPQVRMFAIDFSFF